MKLIIEEIINDWRDRQNKLAIGPLYKTGGSET